ncbi:MAG: VTT domain-containing protein [Ndongobacter sp.]|nr:VTT domain-containing protein [Ndongobacter sp.]
MKPSQRAIEKLNNFDTQRARRIEKRIRIITLIVLIAFGIFLWIGYRNRWFHSARPFADFFLSLGFFGLFFASFLIVINTIFPIIPGSLPSVAGFMAYGTIGGFLLVMAMTLIGSAISFRLSRRFGATFVKAFVPDHIFDDLMKKIVDEKTASRLAAIAFIVPGVPDDATVMICGLTDMRFSRFMLICLLFKPIPTFLYLFGFSSILHWLFTLITHI